MPPETDLEARTMNANLAAVARRLGAAVLLAVAGVVAAGSAAAADVTITPTVAAQGGATSVTFEVHNQRAGTHTTRVEVDLPAATPIAEAYPMTVPDWAPRTVTRRSAVALPGIHGSNLTTATAAVIWTRAADAPAPPAVERLRLEMGPLPQVGELAFTVVQTYADGTTQRWTRAAPGSGAAGPGPVLTLTPDPAGAAAGAPHAGHAALPAESAESAQSAQSAQAGHADQTGHAGHEAALAEPSDSGSDLGLVAAVVLGAMIGGLAVMVVRAGTGR
jgi:uncharacterized protein YcnI